MPKGYVIAHVNITDPDRYPDYASQTPGTVAAFDGRFVVRGGTIHAKEGEPPAPRMVVIEFPDVDRAKAWYDSEAYQAIVGIRQAASEGCVYIVEGAD